MSTIDELLRRAEALRAAAEREQDETVVLLCRTLAHAYETLAARQPAPSHRLLH